VNSRDSDQNFIENLFDRVHSEFQSRHMEVAIDELLAIMNDAKLLDDCSEK
jgi:hypothetical protein